MEEWFVERGCKFYLLLSQMKTFCAHYRGSRGTFAAALLPSSILNNKLEALTQIHRTHDGLSGGDRNLLLPRKVCSSFGPWLCGFLAR
jgi:hypothetical protein